MLVGRGGGINSVGASLPTHGHFVLPPVSLASRDEDGCPSNSTIDPVLMSKFQSEYCSLSHISKKIHILFPLKPTADPCTHSTCQYGCFFRRERSSVSFINTREIRPPTCSLNQQKTPYRVHYLCFLYQITPFIIQLR